MADEADALGAEIQASVRYLGSEAAGAALAADSYWPKWDHPWWHMLLLHEMDETRRIPATAIEQFVASLNAIPLKIFPIRPEDLPAGLDLARGAPCHCQLGNVYRVLAAWGLDVDNRLPWIRPWFHRYQMADGGLTCDETAYRVEDECPSSMVGTIAAFEAMLLHTPQPWPDADAKFISNAAQFLVRRQLRHGSTTRHNARERASAERWPLLCFPRFYQYDVLRGLNALLRWADMTGIALPAEATAAAVADLRARFPDGRLRNQRRSYDGARTWVQLAPGSWQRTPTTSVFPLLTSVSKLGEVSLYLSRQWAEVQERLDRQPLLGRGGYDVG